MRSVGSIVATILPAVAAIAVFGALYGAGARPILGAPLTMASSLLIFSGSLQFALVALLAAGAAAPALLLTAATLNLRHLVMGAVLGRMPAPIFASLATLTLVTADRSLAGGPVLCAALGGLIMSPKRSLPLCLIGGIAGYALAVLLS